MPGRGAVGRPLDGAAPTIEPVADAGGNVGTPPDGCPGLELPGVAPPVLPPVADDGVGLGAATCGGRNGFLPTPDMGSSRSPSVMITPAESAASTASRFPPDLLRPDMDMVGPPTEMPVSGPSLWSAPLA